MWPVLLVAVAAAAAAYVWASSSVRSTHAYVLLFAERRTVDFVTVQCNTYVLRRLWRWWWQADGWPGHRRVFSFMTLASLPDLLRQKLAFQIYNTENTYYMICYFVLLRFFYWHHHVVEKGEVARWIGGDLSAFRFYCAFLYWQKLCRSIDSYSIFEWMTRHLADSDHHSWFSRCLIIFSFSQIKEFFITSLRIAVHRNISLNPATDLYERESTSKSQDPSPSENFVGFDSAAGGNKCEID